MDERDGSYGVYVHVPWCRHRCPYCAFYVVPARGVPAGSERFVDGVLAERSARSDDFPGPADTVFLGGGTPSRLPSPELARLLAGIPRRAGVELEANPEDVGDRWLAGALDAGVDRLSLGIQTLDPAFARSLGRADPAEAIEAIRGVAASAARSWSVDVMFGLPGQPLASFAADLEALLALDPPHLSAYGLTIEPGTAFERMARLGRITPADDDRWRAMYDHLVERTAAAGLARYEVSNFARPGHESAHNQGYWHGRPYLGLGPGAHGLRADGSRWANAPDLEAWLRGEHPTVADEPPDPERIARDEILSALRSCDGIDLGALHRRTGHRPAEAAIGRLVRLGVLARDRDRISLTGDGWPLADGVVARVLAALEPGKPAEC